MPYPMTPATRAPRNDLRPFASPTTAPGASNWGTGVQPARRTTAEINAEQDAANQVARGPAATPATYAPRNLGTMTSADLNRSPNGSPLGVRPSLTGAPVISGYTEYHQGPATRAYAPPMAPQPAPFSPTPSPAAMDFLRTGVAPNLPAPAPYNPPQRTERANPLSGDNNYPVEGRTAAVPSPFVQRGPSLPAGRDAMPVPSGDATIGGSMQGTMDRLRGAGAPSPFARRFGSNTRQQSTYDGYLRRLG